MYHDVVLRPACAQEREVLMGFPRGYTMSLLKKMPEGEQQQQEAEDLRCAAIGNTFHLNTLASLFDMVFSYAGMKEEKGAQKIIDDFVASLTVPPEPTFSKDEVLSETGSDVLGQEDDTLSLVGNEVLEQLQKRKRPFSNRERPLTRSVSAFIRRQECEALMSASTRDRCSVQTAFHVGLQTGSLAMAQKLLGFEGHRGHF